MPDQMPDQILDAAAPPASLSEWERDRPRIRDHFLGLLGRTPALFRPDAEVTVLKPRAGCRVERIVFENGAGGRVSGTPLLPERRPGPFPAIVYMHAHGGRYEVGKEELWISIEGRKPGPELAAAGFAVFAVDSYAFGERTAAGPGGPDERGRAVEHAWFKHFLWRGSSLWGMIVRDDLLALEYLITRPEIDSARIGTAGMSMGGARASWLGALDERVRVTVPIALMNRWRDFSARGRYNGHSFYYYLPGALSSVYDTEHLVSLTAPRVQAVFCGGADPLSAGTAAIADFTRSVYALYGADDAYSVSIEPGVGHRFTRTMFDGMLGALCRGLRPEEGTASKIF